MSSNKKVDIICIVVIICAVVLTIFFMNGEKLGLIKMVDEDSEEYSSSTYFTSNDLNGTWDTTDATVITLENDSIKVSGTGAYVMDGNVYITQSGNYVVSGTLDDGSIIVDAEQYSKVWILLDGVDIYSEDDAAIIVDQADKVFLTLAEGSVNTIETGSTYSDEALEDNTSAAIFSHDDLTINGSGSLTVTTGYKHGIVSKDDLIITGGTITVTAPQDGLRANDWLKITEADITVNVEDDGIHSDSNFYMESGTLLINECYEGIEALIIDIAGGDITIYPSDDGLNANGGSSDMFGMGGQFNQENTEQESTDIETTVTETSDEENSDEEESYINISGGTLTIINETGRDADGIDSNSDIYISGGTILISLTNSGSNNAIDYGSESGGVCVITGGTVIAAGSSAMAEQFDSSSTQCAILYTLSEAAEENTEISVLDSEGNTILSWVAPFSFSSLNLSSPDIKIGETYTIVTGDTTETITIEEVSSTLGEATGTGFGGGMNQGDSANQGDGFQRMGRGKMNIESSESGEMPEFNNSEASGEIPEFDSENARGGMQMQPPGDMQNNAEPEETYETTATSLKNLSELDTEVWILLAVSMIVLIGGLTFVFFYRKK